MLKFVETGRCAARNLPSRRNPNKILAFRIDGTITCSVQTELKWNLGVPSRRNRNESVAFLPDGIESVYTDSNQELLQWEAESLPFCQSKRRIHRFTSPFRFFTSYGRKAKFLFRVCLDGMLSSHFDSVWTGCWGFYFNSIWTEL